MMRGADRFKHILEKYIDRPILLYGDPDTDGLISLRFMCEFCNMLGLSYTYYVNEHRYHGFELSLKDLRGYLVIASDFAITQAEVEAMVANDIVLLSTDHHEVQSEFIDVVGETAEGIVINNQYPFEPEEDRYQSGAGVFYELVCSLYPEFKSKERDALVGLTLLSDMRPIENNKAKKYLRSAYSYDSSVGFIGYLVASCQSSDYDFGQPKFDRNFIDYNISPTINALLRANKTQECIDFILGKGLPNFDAKGLQKSLMMDMSLRAQIKVFTHIAYIVINTSDFLDYNVKVSSYIGLFCNDYKDKHGGISTLGFVVENGHVIRASFRGRYDDVHYRSGFKNLGIHAEGHPGAFGIQDFQPSTQDWYDIDDLVGDLEANHTSTITIIKASNLAFVLNKDGSKIAMENQYVRDMYRTYIKYTGSNAKIVKKTYKQEEFDSSDYACGTKADVIVKGVKYKYLRDSEGNPIPKYIEYLVDGRKVKSFGVTIEDGVILPMLEKGYIQLYLRSALS